VSDNRGWIGTLAVGLVAMVLVDPAAAAPGRQVQIDYQGAALNGWLTEVESPRATVLMLHGTLAHANMEIMAGFAEVMAESGIESLRVTLSLGESDREGMYDCASTHRHTQGSATGELEAWMDWLADHGRQNIVVLGHSRGTNQVARYVVQHAPGRAAGMVLVAPSVYRPQLVSADYQETTGDPLQPLLEKARALVAAGQGDTLMSDVHMLYCPDAKASAEAFLSYYDADPDYDTLALALAGATPALVVVGTEDPLSAGVEDALAAGDPENRISLLVVEGADHFFRDLYAYDVVDGIIAWLDRVDPE
jgi:pimeloyl-ACP methyl ester carboxylesterase